MLSFLTLEWVYLSPGHQKTRAEIFGSVWSYSTIYQEQKQEGKDSNSNLQCGGWVYNVEHVEVMLILNKFIRER